MMVLENGMVNLGEDAIPDWNDTTSKEMEDMINEGVTSFKMYMAYKDTLQVDDGIIFKALKELRS